MVKALLFAIADGAIGKEGSETATASI